MYIVNNNFLQMAPKKKRGGLNRELIVGEEFRIAMNLALKKFRNTEEEKGTLNIVI